MIRGEGCGQLGEGRQPGGLLELLIWEAGLPQSWLLFTEGPLTLWDAKEKEAKEALVCDSLPHPRLTSTMLCAVVHVLR